MSKAGTSWGARSARRFRHRTPIDHQDVTTIVGLLGDIREDVGIIRRLLEEEDDGEEEDPEADA